MGFPVNTSGPSARDCCVGTDEGQSYGNPGSCMITQCIGKLIITVLITSLKIDQCDIKDSMYNRNACSQNRSAPGFVIYRSCIYVCQSHMSIRPSTTCLHAHLSACLSVKG